MCLAYIISAIAIIILSYIIMDEYKKGNEGFYPHWGFRNGQQWGWNRNYIDDTGNWRPYNYYPSYSGYWRECNSGSWCPPYVSCKDPACQ